MGYPSVFPFLRMYVRDTIKLQFSIRFTNLLKKKTTCHSGYLKSIIIIIIITVVVVVVVIIYLFIYFQLTCSVKNKNKKRTIPVIVRVSDINDNAPHFINTPYETTVSEVSDHSLSLSLSLSISLSHTWPPSQKVNSPEREREREETD